jgi:hypothetical protein
MWETAKAMAVARRCQFGFVSLAPPRLWMKHTAALAGMTVGHLAALWEWLSE